MRRLRGETSVAFFEDHIAAVALPEAQRGREVLDLEEKIKEKNAELDALKGKYQNVLPFSCLCGRFSDSQDAAAVSLFSTGQWFRLKLVLALKMQVVVRLILVS